MKWHDYIKHWRYFVRPDGFVDIACPTMHNGEANSFRAHREIYEEFRTLTNSILSNGYKGWLSGTGIKNAHVMRMFCKSGAQPYSMNRENIFFIFKGRT